jgi:hypothetical protein
MNMPSYITFRITALIFAVLLGTNCVWLLSADICRPGISRLPIDAPAAAAAAGDRVAAGRAASIGVIRGDLWAEAAFTYADLLWTQDRTSANVSQNVQRAYTNLNRALGDAPSQSDAWLLLTGLSLRYRLPNVKSTEALKMSYYTGPTDYQLMPLRVAISAQFPAFDDTELREMIGRDLRLLVAGRRQAAIAQAYEIASPAGKTLIERTVAEVDPTALGFIKSDGRKAQ